MSERLNVYHKAALINHFDQMEANPEYFDNLMYRN